MAFTETHTLIRGMSAQISPTIRDLCWAAGFLEGEGCFKGFQHCESRSWCTEIDAAQVDVRPVVKLLSMFGGSFGETDRTGSREAGKNHQDNFWWRVSGPRARGIMMTLYPLLVGEKRKTVHAALLGIQGGGSNVPA